MIERKRTLFAGDPRLLGPARVHPGKGGGKVFVETRLPPGYRVGGREG